jgi:hypothetical protein
VAAAALGRFWKVISAIGVTAQTALALLGHLARVSGVAVIAVSMTRHAVQRWQLARGVAAGAGRRFGDAARPVRAMAARAAAAQIAVRRPDLGGMTAGARLRNLTRVRIVALGALPMAGGSRAVRLDMARLAFLGDAAAVRLVAGPTLSMLRQRTARDAAVAAVARDQAHARPMRQAGVALGAALMAARLRGPRYLSAVAARAKLPIVALETELVRRMAAGASGSPVKPAVAVGRLMAAGAGLGAAGGCGRRMHVVAARTGAAVGSGMIGALAGVTADAVGAPRALDRVRRVAARARLVRLDSPLAQDAHVLVALAARDRFALLVVVREMTAGALAVAVLEHGARGHDRRRLGVALDASTARRQGGRVLILMAGGADLGAVLALCGVRGRDVVVALVTLRGHYGRLLVRSMTAVAVTALGVHDHGRRAALRTGVAAHAIPGVRTACVRRIGGKSVTIDAIRRRARAELAARPFERVRDAGSLFVALHADGGRGPRDLLSRQIVAFCAFDLFVVHVNAMASRIARGLPLGLHVEPLARLLLRRPSFGGGIGLIGARRYERQQRHEPQEHRRAQSGVHEVSNIIPALRASSESAGCDTGVR